ncbi:MAG: CheY-like receiver protein [Chlamydiales bacterium]|jgi:CheY-like chemotaxis protein|nr:CheY-like receiver protein [Chlamydiales bacterium]
MHTEYSILVIEDNSEEYEATKRYFRKAGAKCPIFRCKNGDEALDFLHRKGSYSNPDVAPRPNIILLDLNLPGTDGREVLAEIKKDQSLNSIPVIILTSSKDEKDINECYLKGANSYICKSFDHLTFYKMIEQVHHYWFQTTKLPNHSFS